MGKKNKVSLVRWKIIVLVLVAVLFMVRIGYIAIRGEVDKEYKTSYDYDLSQAVSIPCSNITETFISSYDRLNSLELIFTGIANDKAGMITVCIFSDNSLLYQTNVTLANVNNYEWKKILVNAPICPGEKYKITLNANEECTQIPNLLVLSNGYASEIVETYSDEQKIEGNVVLNFGYLQFPELVDRIVMISLWMILYVIIFYVVKHIEMILKWFAETKEVLLANVNESAFLYIFEFILSIVILNCSGIEFQEMTKVVFYVISFAAVTNNKNKKTYINGLLNKNWKRVLWSLLYAYASFALVGQRTLIYPLTLKLSAHSLFVLICAVLWFIPVINSIVFYIDQVAKSSFGKRMAFKNWRFIIVLLPILLLPAVYNLFANNPGISTTDTLNSMIINAQNLYGMYDWHPAFYCMVLRVIEEVWNSTYAVIAVQYFFWVYVMIELFMYLRKKGLSDKIIVFSALFCGLNAGNFVHLNTIWKDIPYTLSLLWVFIIVAKLVIDYDEYKGKWYIYLELIVALIGVFFYRKNGMVSYVVIALVLGTFLWKNKKVLGALLVSIVMICVVKGPVYSYYNIEDPGVRGMYHGLGLDILGAYYSGGEVSDSTLKMINMMTSYNNAEYNYNPTWSNQSYDVMVEPKEFVINYIDTFIKNPLIMTRAVIDRVDAMWDIYRGQDTKLGCVNYTGTQDGQGEWNDYYPERIYRSLYTEMSAATAYTASTQWIAAIEWRSGLFSLLGLICIVWLIIRYGKGKYIVMISPIVAHIMSLILSTGWSDFRYFWPLNLMNFSLILLTIVIVHKKEYEKIDA